MPYKKCKVCGQSFYSRPNKGKRGKYCSRECYNKDRRAKWVSFTCANCGKTFRRPKWRFNTKPMRHYFCSIKCYGEYRSKHPEQFPLYSRKYEIKVAKELTEEVLRKEYLENGLKIKEIAKKYHCGYGTIHKRIKKYGIPTDRSRYYTKHSEDYWRRYMNKKYNHTCQVCGWNKDICDVAHRIPRRKNGKYIEENLILLCPNCHRLFDKGKLSGI